VASCELHYELEGPRGAPLVVLVPSLGTELSIWEPQAARLRSRWRVLRCDIRGHGGSPVPDGPYEISDLGTDLLALLDRLDVRRASLCGISIGGMTSMWVAANAPERVQRLIVCCSSALIDPEKSYRQRARTVRERGIEAIADAVIARWISPQFAERSPEVAADLRERLLATPREGYAGCCEALAEMDLRGSLAAIDAPALVIAGAEDPATPPEHGRLIADGIAGARLEVVADAMHLANLEQPEAVGSLIEAFLSEHEQEDAQ
jgi:3-oxoadipate enol-lactonase